MSIIANVESELRAGVTPDRCDVVVVDDHAVLAGALASALSNQPDFDLILTAGDVEAGARLMAQVRPRLAVLDVRLDGGDGLTLLAELPTLSPGTRALVLTAHVQPVVVSRARKLGAYAVLAKGTTLPDLLRALRAVAAGRNLLAELPVGSDEGRGQRLTVRETEILQLLAAGRDPAQISRQLGLSTHTIRDHVKSIRSKLGVQTQLAAVAEAVHLGIIELDTR